MKENTKPGSTVVTDGNRAYGDLGDRKHEVKNLSRENSLPAHIELRGIHRVFSNLKRLGMGVYHGFREKHLNAYLNEFVFRWNRRRSFATNMNRMLNIGMFHEPLTYRQIVGDNSAWRRQHRKQIYKLTKPDRLKEAKLIAKTEGRDTLDVLLAMSRNYGAYIRTEPQRPVRSHALAADSQCAVGSPQCWRIREKRCEQATESIMPAICWSGYSNSSAMIHLTYT